MSQTDVNAKCLNLAELKSLLAENLRDAGHLKTPDAVPTGLIALDQFLASGGFAKGTLSLLRGRLGAGATSMWLDSAAHVLQNKRWAAWVNHDTPLSPVSLAHQLSGAQGAQVDLSRFVSIEVSPSEQADDKSGKKIFWLLQELMSSSLFDLIGCDLGTRHPKEHQLRKLQAQARAAQIALVFLSRLESPALANGSVASVFSLILSFEKERILVERAQHRPTPHSFSRSVSYARFLGHSSSEPYSLPQT